MSETFLKERLIKTLFSADLENASEEAQYEVIALIKKLRSDHIKISNDAKGLKEVTQLMEYVKQRFPELKFAPTDDQETSNSLKTR